jgi:hypothetical protein
LISGTTCGESGGRAGAWGVVDTISCKYIMKSVWHVDFKAYQIPVELIYFYTHTINNINFIYLTLYYPVLYFTQYVHLIQYYRSWICEE